MAAVTSPALFLGKCVSSAVKKTVRVVVTRFELDTFLMAELPERLSLRIAHKVEKIVYKDGNIIDPLTGQKCIFTDFVKDVDKESELFGLSPPHKAKAFPDTPEVKEISNK
ncbi:hypothetical protein HPB51_025762 [Rhipicephalus microplus]|uniref:Uncharacterized protein n=1 Tax=Rhipicephalus microplus TaxID=6941 RepID=A0A9J6DDW1_RHIMP|nr:hypothetical protein HPB51_025762 [Rhipicephalus microplus]